MGGFICEALVSSGLRHSGGAELCEDSVGVVTTPSGAVFFIADATSDEGGMGPFSSRYLANCLGYWFLSKGLSALDKRFDKIDVDKVFSGALDSMQASWLKEWAAFLKKPEAAKEFEKHFEAYRSKEGGGGVKSFSTAFMGGVIMGASERRAMIVRTGDIDLVVKRAGHAPSRKDIRKDRIFAQFIKKSDNHQPRIRFSDTVYEVYSASMVDYLIAKTDGVSFLNDELTIKAMADGGAQGVLKFRRILLKGIKSGAGDDRALFYIAFL
ncbi:MAG TPA: hypothetical protein ENI77_08195 [Nitrospirae bacterium]|nr:hypothetical protein [Nitrospirota bacterium]